MITKRDLHLLWCELIGTKHKVEDLLNHAKGTATLAQRSLTEIEGALSYLKKLEDRAP